MQSFSTIRTVALVAALAAPLSLAQGAKGTQSTTRSRASATAKSSSSPGAMAAAGTEQMTRQSVEQEIRDTFGSVPSFLRQLPDAALPGAWQVMKGVELNPTSAIPPKYKELIGLSVAAQIPCEYCIYFHTEAARANGASENEIREALTESALTREFSTLVNGTGQDLAAFRAEIDRSMGGSTGMGGAGTAGTPCPNPSAAQTKAMGATPEQMKQDAQKCPPGMVPAQPQGTGGGAAAGTRSTATQGGTMGAGMTPPPTAPAPDATTASREMMESMGGIPTFMSHVPDAMRAGLWNQWKFEMSSNTAIPPKYKVLMSMAVAAQIPCTYCVYADRKEAQMLGATDDEIDEAVAMASTTRFFSTILNGSQTDLTKFRAETRQMLKNVARNQAAMGGAGKAGAEPEKKKETTKEKVKPSPEPRSTDKIDREQ